ncbi:hypothetical protein ACFLIN_03040 [Corynebacterium kutscheri]|uniref:hypothetical protein n=1 Tax=Corynebacterium kutscheri TaxID=35755 RepID=UPI0037BE5C0A
MSAQYFKALSLTFVCLFWIVSCGKESPTTQEPTSLNVESIGKSYIAISESIQHNEYDGRSFVISKTGVLSNIQSFTSVYNNKLVAFDGGYAFATPEGILKADRSGNITPVDNLTNSGVLSEAYSSPDGRHAIFTFNEGFSYGYGDSHEIRIISPSGFVTEPTLSYPYGVSVCNDRSSFWLDVAEPPASPTAEIPLGAKTTVVLNRPEEKFSAELPLHYASISRASFNCATNTIFVIHYTNKKYLLAQFIITEDSVDLVAEREVECSFYTEMPDGDVLLPNGFMVVNRDGSFTKIPHTSDEENEYDTFGIDGHTVQKVYFDGRFLNVSHLASGRNADTYISSFTLDNFKVPISTTHIPDSAYNNKSKVSNIINGRSAMAGIIALD